MRLGVFEKARRCKTKRESSEDHATMGSPRSTAQTDFVAIVIGIVCGFAACGLLKIRNMENVL